METLEKNKIKERIAKITSLFLLLLIMIALGVSFYYNYTLQNQVNERDILIEKLTQRDSILNKIIDFHYDSISKSTSWEYRIREGKVLKYNELANELDKSNNDYNQISITHNQIIAEKNQNINDYKYLSNSFNLLNKDYNELLKKYSLLIAKYNENISDQNKLVGNYNLISDSLSSFKSIVRLIQSNYNIDYNINRKGNIKEISIKANKLDSALVLLPYFRDRLKLDKEKKVWIINTGKK